MKTIQKPENRIWNPEMECMSRGDMSALQLARLQKIVRTAWDRQPFYRAKMEAAGAHPDQIKTLDDIRRLPFTTKDDLRGCFPYKGFAVPMEDIVRVHASSGTTGQATVVGYTRGDLDRWSECMARLQTAAGVTPRDIVQIVMGYGFFTGGLGHHYGIEKLGATVLPVSAGKSERQIRIMCDYRTTVLIATPSYALRLAELAAQMGVADKLHLRVALFGSESWGEEMRRQLQQNIGVFATDNYGLSEVQGPGVSYECVEQNGMHIAEDHFLPELIDSKTCERASDPFGAGGELVITTLTKEGIPVIRYRTRDLCHFMEGPCPCGRTGLRMSKVSARSDDMLIIRGVNVFPQQIEKALLSVPGTAPHYQIVVSRPGAMDELEVQVEATVELFADQMRKQQDVIRQIQEKLQNDVLVRAKIRLVEPGSLPRFEGKASRVKDLRKAPAEAK
jgi:phenylacetate-CoA ligase